MNCRNEVKEKQFANDLYTYIRKTILANKRQFLATTMAILRKFKKMENQKKRERSMEGQNKRYDTRQ